MIEHETRCCETRDCARTSRKLGDAAFRGTCSTETYATDTPQAKRRRCIQVQADHHARWTALPTKLVQHMQLKQNICWMFAGGDYGE